MKRLLHLHANIGSFGDISKQTWQPASHLSHILSLDRGLTEFFDSTISIFIKEGGLILTNGMGLGESTTRKVSYGVDDEDRVRILRGVKVIMLLLLACDDKANRVCGALTPRRKMSPPHLNVLQAKAELRPEPTKQVAKR